MNLDIEMINETKENLDAYNEWFNAIAMYSLELIRVEEDIEFSVSIVDDVRIHEMNKEYRHIDKPTDVITFALEDDESPYIEGMPRLLGDVFISIDKAKQQAQEYGHSFKRELCFLFTHGLLHLLGYDHMEEEEEKIMNEMQNTILKNFDILRK